MVKKYVWLCPKHPKQTPALSTSFNEPQEICVTLSKQKKKRGEKVLIVAKKKEEKRGKLK